MHQVRKVKLRIVSELEVQPQFYENRIRREISDIKNCSLLIHFIETTALAQQDYPATNIFMFPWREKRKETTMEELGGIWQFGCQTFK